MAGKFKFINIFETTMVRGARQKLVNENAVVEFFSGHRSYPVPVQVTSILPKGEGGLIGTIGRLTLEASKRYVSVATTSAAENPYEAIVQCENNVDQAITELSIIHTPGIFSREIYRGWLVESERWIMHGCLKIEEPVKIDAGAYSTAVNTLRSTLASDAELRSRFITMSRFFSKSIKEHPSEEKFLFLWTILEVFPMKNTTNIKPISEYLSKLIGRQTEEIKSTLGIGKLFRIRSKLVHDGKLSVPISEMGELFDKLESICIEILRGMTGLPYSGRLDRYFSPN